MNNLEKNALRIAELKGHNEWRLHNIQDVLISRYTAYDYLMPIRFECNSNDSVDCFIELGTHEVTVIRNESDYRNYPYNRKSEPEFIEAFQLACIKYLELKCQQRNIADNIE